MTFIQDVAFPANAFPAFSINPDDIGEIQQLYQSVAAWKDAPAFCLLIDSSNTTGDPAPFFEAVIAFTFHHAYLKQNFNTPFLLIRTQNDDDHFIQLLSKKLASHGYAGLDCVKITDNSMTLLANGDYSARLLPQTNVGAIEDYSRTLVHSTTPATLFLCPAPEPEKIDSLLQAFRRTEETLLAEHPYIHSLLTRNNSLKETQRQLQIELGLLEEQAGSLKSYQSFYNEPNTGYRAKVKEITDFYNNEYEILPLWYKRFGHILKVMLGKRTFRSLFDDNVKKYKV